MGRTKPAIPHSSRNQAPDGTRAVALRQGAEARLVPGATTTRDLALAAIAAQRSLLAEIAARGPGPSVDLVAALMQDQAR